MSLERVTITGADDDVNVLDLVALSKEFPFVEWGLLFSAKREGQARYPSHWWRSIYGCSRLEHGLRTALHLCGQASRETQFGSNDWVGRAKDAGPYRVQLNGYELGCRPPDLRPDVTWILQARGELTLQAAANHAASIGAEVLFDPSGGTGFEPFRWPVPPLGCRMGYAGGIRPDNVRLVLDLIAESRLHASGGYWIDMESGVRTGDKLDLAKVRRVLRFAAPYVERASS